MWSVISPFRPEEEEQCTVHIAGETDQTIATSQTEAEGSEVQGSPLQRRNDGRDE